MRCLLSLHADGNVRNEQGDHLRRESMVWWWERRPAVEVIVGGLELATLVFMNLEESEEGDIELKGDRYREMPCKSSILAMALSDFVGLLRNTHHLRSDLPRNGCLAQRFVRLLRCRNPMA